MPNKCREIKSSCGGLFLCGVGDRLSHRTSGLSLLVWWFEQALPHDPFSPAGFQGREELLIPCVLLSVSMPVWLIASDGFEMLY